MKPGSIVHCISDSCRGYIPFSKELVVSSVQGDFLEVKDLAGKKYVAEYIAFRKGKPKLNSIPRRFTHHLDENVYDRLERLDQIDYKVTEPVNYQLKYEALVWFFPELKPVVGGDLGKAWFDGNKIHISFGPIDLIPYVLMHEIFHFLESDEPEVFQPNWGLGQKTYGDDLVRESNTFIYNREFVKFYYKEPKKACTLNERLKKKVREILAARISKSTNIQNDLIYAYLTK